MKTQETALVPNEEPNNNVATTQERKIEAVVVDLHNLDSIVESFKNAIPLPISMIPETWTPEAKDYNKPFKLIFMGGSFEEFIDQDGVSKWNPKAYFGKLITPEGEKPYLQTIRIGCIDLVAAFLNISKETRTVTPKQPVGSAWQICYTGTRPSKTNPVNKINTFSVLPLQK